MAQKKTTTIDSLDALQVRKDALSADVDKSEEKLSDIWNSLFHEQTEEEKNSPTQRALAFVSSSAGVIDGAILGWKLYRKFTGNSYSLPFFRRKKKKK